MKKFTQKLSETVQKVLLTVAFGLVVSNNTQKKILKLHYIFFLHSNYKNFGKVAPILVNILFFY